jgi:flagellar biosynthetic protein FlhB
MAEKPAAEKTEQPTSKRLQKAREEGRVPQGQEMGAAVILVVLLVTVAFLAPGLFEWFKARIEAGLSCDVAAFTDASTFVAYMNGRIVDAMVVILPILAAIFLAAVFTGMAISGLSFSPGAIQFKLDAINPASALQRAFNIRSAVRLLVSIAKLLLVSLIVWFYLRSKMETLVPLRWAWSTEIIAAIAKLTFGLAIRVGVVMIILGLADTLYQKWQYLQDMKMTKQEVKQERKSTDGSPEVKARIRRIQLEMSMKRLAQEVPKANVILVNPTHVAVALRYDAKTMEAPVLLAKGADHVAQKIMEIGRSYGVPIVRRPEVARAIFASVKPGQPIPESLYMAVAEVLAMIYQLRQKKRAAQQQVSETE